MLLVQRPLGYPMIASRQQKALSGGFVGVSREKVAKSTRARVLPISATTLRCGAKLGGAAIQPHVRLDCCWAAREHSPLLSTYAVRPQHQVPLSRGTSKRSIVGASLASLGIAAPVLCTTAFP